MVVRLLPPFLLLAPLIYQKWCRLSLVALLQDVERPLAAYATLPLATLSGNPLWQLWQVFVNLLQNSFRFLS